jgi:hypothetical protein
MPGRREAHAMAWMALAAGVIVCGASLLLGFQGKTLLGRPLGGDFVEFYTVGTILNHYAPARIYDVELADRLQHAALPTMPQTQMLVFGQAPFIASLFRPLARLPYRWAYAAWLGFSACLYIAALALLFRTVRLNARDRTTGFLLALSWTPFLFETWIGGQMSVVIFSIWVLFFWRLENERQGVAALRVALSTGWGARLRAGWGGGFGAGCILALCLFKPTLVALPALMLLAGRRWRVLGGLTAGGVAMALLSVVTVGAGGCRAWFGILAMNASILSKPVDAAHLAKYIDLLACSRLLFPHWLAAARAASILAGAVLLVWLAVAWWKSSLPGELGAGRRLWAATICCTLVVNPYAPIYDSLLVVAAAALAASGGRMQSQRRQSSDGLASSGGLAGWLLLLYLVPWVTQSFAEFLHLQLMTAVLAGFAIWLLETNGELRMRHSTPSQEKSTMTSPAQLRATGRFQVRSRGLP